jgi:hypothetical protein
MTIEDTYAGESWAKKLARARYWELVHTHFLTRIIPGQHLVLASRECGDLAVCDALGYDCVGAERNHDAYKTAFAKYGDRVVFGDVARVASGRRLCHAFLDFCGVLNGVSAQTVADVAEHISVGGLLGVAFQKGRDPYELKSAIQPRSRRERRMLQATSRRAGLGHAFFSGESVGQADIQQETPSVRRALLLASSICLGWVKNRHPCYVRLVRILEYTGHRVPMMVGLFHIRGRPTLERDADDVQLHGDRIAIEELPSGDEARVAVRSLILDGTDPRIFNIQPATVAAWKAHQTRGSYGGLV